MLNIETLNKDFDITIRVGIKCEIKVHIVSNESVRIKRPLLSFRIQSLSSESKISNKVFRHDETSSYIDNFVTRSSVGK